MSNSVEAAAYAHPEAVVTTEVADGLLYNPSVRVMDCSPAASYEAGHLENAVSLSIQDDLHNSKGELIDSGDFEYLLSRHGIGSTVSPVFYSNEGNLAGTYAYWVFQLFGHVRQAVIDGGLQKWDKERRPLTTAVEEFEFFGYLAGKRDDLKLRALPDALASHVAAGGIVVTSGAVPDGLDLTGADLRDIPWQSAIDDDGAFLPADALAGLYIEKHGLKKDDEIVVIDNTHTWFVLHQLLGFSHVRNYDAKL